MKHLVERINEAYAKRQLELKEVTEHNRLLMMELFNSGKFELFDKILKNLHLDVIDDVFVYKFAEDIVDKSKSEITYDIKSVYDKDVNCHTHSAEIMARMRKGNAVLYQLLVTANYRTIAVIDNQPWLKEAYIYLDKIFDKSKESYWNWFLGDFTSYQSSDTYKVRVYNINKAKIHLDQ